MHAHPLGTDDVDVGSVTHEERLRWRDAEALEGVREDRRMGFPPADLVRHHDRVEEVGHAGSIENVEGGRGVVEVRDHGQPRALAQVSEERPVMGGKVSGAAQLAAVGVDEIGHQRRGKRGWVESQPPQEVSKALRRRHLARIERTQAFCLAPAVPQRSVAGVQGDRRVRRAASRSWSRRAVVCTRWPLISTSGKRVESNSTRVSNRSKRTAA